MSTTSDVLGVADARKELPRMLAHFREQGADSEVFHIGKGRQANAVLMAAATYELITEIFEEIAIEQMLRERRATDTGHRTSHEDFLTEIEDRGLMS